MIHETAVIHSQAVVFGATVGARTKIWQFATVIRGTVLGEDCTVAAGACLDGPVFGDRCIISPGVDMGPGFIIGNDVFVGPHVVLCNDYWPRAHKDGFDYEGLRDGSIVCIRIHDGASLGVGAAVMPGVTIGRNAMVAAHAVVTHDVPDNYIWTRSGEIRAIREEPERMRTT